MTKPLWKSPNIWGDAHSIPGQGGLLAAIGSQRGFWLHAVPALGTVRIPGSCPGLRGDEGSQEPESSSLIVPSRDHVVLPDTSAFPCWDGVIPSKDPNREQKKSPFSLGSPQNIQFGGDWGKYVTTSFHFLGLPSPPCPPGLEGTELPLFLRAETCMQCPEFSR